MKNIDKEIKKLLVISLLVSVLFVAGIPGIIIFASKGLTPLMVISIVAVAFGFYATPMFWLAYGNKIHERNLVRLIESGITTLDGLSANFSGGGDIRAGVMAVISKGYLKGYVLHDDGVIEKIKKEAVILTVKCPVCGGTATKIANNRYKCDYCKSVFEM